MIELGLFSVISEAPRFASCSTLSSSLHCPGSPFFPTRPCFQHGCRSFSVDLCLWRSKNAIAGLWAIGHGSNQATAIQCRKIMKVKRFISFTTLCFQGAKPETIRKLTRNGVCVGPRTLSELTIWLRRIGLANSKRQSHRVSQSQSLISQWVPPPLQYSADIHVPGVLAPRSVSCTVAWWSNRRNCWKFSERRLVYKLVFTQYALFPQPSLREGLAGYAAE